MTAIVNRTPTGRLISLLAEVKYLKARYGSYPFNLNGLKFDPSEEFNPLMFFQLAKTNPKIGLYDPYLDNPLSPAKFHLTQSTAYDTQKSKSASECLNALEALGWVERDGDSAFLNSVGMQVAGMDYDSEEFVEIARESVLGYGVFIGFLFKCQERMDRSTGVVEKRNIEIGYKNTRETTQLGGKKIPLSTGSQKDTIVRTRATLFAWAVTTGFSLPLGYEVPKALSSWHLETLDEIKKKVWSWHKMKMFIPDELFCGSHNVARPLSYRWMTKSTKSLRERGQGDVRSASLKEEEKVKNRRFAIVLALALAAEAGASISFRKFVTQLSKVPELFVVSKSDFDRVMSIEKDIAIVSGIPFTDSGGNLSPLTVLNTEALRKGAPKKVIEKVCDIFKKVKI